MNYFEISTKFYFMHCGVGATHTYIADSTATIVYLWQDSLIDPILLEVGTVISVVILINMFNYKY